MKGSQCTLFADTARFEGSEKIHYLEAKARLAEDLLQTFPQIERSEVEAIVGHWMQSPQSDIPYTNRAVRELCDISINGKRIAGKRAGANVCWDDVPFPPAPKHKFTFIDLFAGIGGFRIAMQSVGGRCLFSSEWDSAAKKTYESNFGEVPFGDIRKIPEMEIAKHDVLCAGFPCQPFSLAGVSARNSLDSAHGFACETQGTLFFDIARIIEAKKPKIVFLENVKNLVGHDGGKTFSVIRKSIRDLGYSFNYKLIDASSLVPQKRVRCYIVCIRGGKQEFKFPEFGGEPLPLKSILEKRVDERFTISSKLWEGHQARTSRNLARGTGFTAFCADINKPSNTIVARYGKDGKECLIPQHRKNPRMLTPRECARLQGFPEIFRIPNAKTTAYRQFGNSVAVPVVQRIAERISQQI